MWSKKLMHHTSVLLQEEQQCDKLDGCRPDPDMDFSSFIYFYNVLFEIKLNTYRPL